MSVVRTLLSRRASADESRAGHLAESADLLWQEPATWSLNPPGRRPVDLLQELIVVPSASRPRLLVPAQRRLAAAAVRGGPQGQGRVGRASRTALDLAFRSGLGTVVFRDRLIVRGPEDADRLRLHLDQVTGVRGHWAMPITRGRANRKPVIQVIDDVGRCVAFVKVGTTALTTSLVLLENDALRWLASRDIGATIPRVLDCGEVGALTVLVLEPMPRLVAQSVVTWDDVVEIAVSVAQADGTSCRPLASHPYWPALRRRLSHAGDRGHALRRTWETLDCVSHIPLTWGSWHGDFAPWNMGRSAHGPLLWDFERFGIGVPAGFDLAHFDLQTRVLRRDVDPVDVVNQRVAGALDLLAPHGGTATQRRLVHLLYLLEIAARWQEDGQDQFGRQGVVLDAVTQGAMRGAARLIEDLSGKEGAS